MPLHRIAASRIIDASPQRLYDLLADYREGHPRILPRPQFGSLTIIEGGRGQGTVFDVEVRLLGRRRNRRGIVSEPVPGRQLVECYAGEPTVTSFTIEPMFSGEHARVTISTDTDVHRGLRGALERRIATRLLRPLYQRELAQLAAVATTGAAAQAEQPRYSGSG
jgi:Polyketide cyclase / dehydrase and lipid transport